MRAGRYSFCRGAIFLLSGAALWAGSTATAEEAENPSAPLQTHTTIDHTTIDGSVLYGKLCAECHGAKGEPPEEVSVLTNPPRSLATLHRGPSESSEEMHRRLVRIIREGIGENMLPFRDRLSEEQIRAVARYITTLAPPPALPQGGEVPSPSAPQPPKPPQVDPQEDPRTNPRTEQ